MLKTCTSSKAFRCFWYSLHSFVVSFHQSRSRLSCAFARQANAQLGVPSPRRQLQEHSEHTHNNIYWTQTVSKAVLIVMHVWLCVSEFNRRWKCEAAGPPHHTQQHPGSPVKCDHCVSTRTHTGGHVLISCKPDSWICAVAEYGSAWFSTLQWYRGCFLKRSLLGPPYLRPAWDSRGPTGDSQPRTASSACSWKPRTHLISASASYFITCVQCVCSYNLQLPLRACGAESVVTKTTTKYCNNWKYSNKIFTKVSSERLMPWSVLSTLCVLADV